MKRIFILHGWTYTTDRWNECARLLQEGGCEIVVLSVPGLTSETDQPWTLEQYVEWLKVELKNEEMPVVVGHSNGGRIALAFAAKYPNMLSHLILIGAAGIYHNEWPLRTKRAVFSAIAKVGKKLVPSATLRKLLYRAAGAHDYERASPIMKKTMQNLITVDLTGELAKINTPTLLIWGKKDNQTPLSDGQKMNTLIKDSNLFVIDEAGHSPHFSHPKLVAEKIIAAIQ